MNNDTLPMWQRWAQFRFAVIGKLLSSPPPKGQLQKAIEALARQTYRHPIDADRQISLGASTIERWYYKANGAVDPIAALGRKIRRDAGIRWSMSEMLLAALKAQYDIGPRLVLSPLSPDQLHDYLSFALEQAGNSSLMTDELMRTLAAHAANNLRVLNQMAAELLATAAQRNLPRIDETLFFEFFAPSNPKPRRKQRL